MSDSSRQFSGTTNVTRIEFMDSFDEPAVSERSVLFADEMLMWRSTAVKKTVDSNKELPFKAPSRLKRERP